MNKQPYAAFTPAYMAAPAPRKLNLQQFAETKCKNAEVKAEKLHEMKLEDLRACNCGRCSGAADTKELDELRVFRQEQELKEAAKQQAKELAAEIIATGKTVDNELKGMVNDLVKEELQKAGMDLSTPIQRIVEKKMQFDVSSAPRVNGQYGRQQMSPQMKNFVHWAKTGEVLERKVLNEGAAGAGGILVPEEFRAEVIRKLAVLTVMRRAGARAIPMGGDSLTFPVLQASGSGAWTAENTAFHEEDPTLGDVTLTPHKYTRLVRTSTELLEDSAIDVASLLSDIFAEDFVAAEDLTFINGTGAGQPTGLYRAAVRTLASTGTTTDALIADLTRTIYSVPRRYRQGSVWFIPGSLIETIALMRDTTGKPIWIGGNIQDGEPARLLGYPVFETDEPLDYDLDGAGAGTALGNDIVFGNPRYYYIGDRQQMRLDRSTERYFELGQVAFRADMRVDGKVALTDPFAKLTGVPLAVGV